MNISLLHPPQISLPSARSWFFDICLRNLPRPLLPVIAWADQFYRVMSKDAEFFDSTRSPWLIEPLQMADDPLVSNVTYVKPIQIGGTSLGEILLMRWILGGNGLIHYNWPTNDKARDRWEKFTEKRLKACRPVRSIMPELYEDCLVKFPNITFAMQGVFTTGNLDSDTVDYIINEEIHQWNAGMLGKAKGRQTRVTFPKCVNISNGGLKGDQLHQEFNEGTQQQFEIKCPGCGQYHIMRTRWEDSRPDLGGLRYDSDGCKRPDGTFDYNKLVPTIRFQMPCGYEMRDDVRERRQAAQGGRYSEPFNTGALLTNRSYTLQAVACHDIRWLDLIQEKHQALRSLKAGDDTDFRRYMQEREAVFYDADEHRPFQGQILIRSGIKKSRTGLPDRAARLWAADKQKGYRHKGQLGHYWLVIRDVMENCDSLLVYEGMVQTDTDLIAILDDHQCQRHCGVIDGTWDTRTVEEFCYRNNINMVIGSPKQEWFYHKKTRTRHFYSEIEPLHKRMKMPHKFGYTYGPGGVVPMAHEPVVWFYNKAGLIDNLLFLRNHRANVERAAQGEIPPRIALPVEYIAHDIPEDVSEDYKLQNDSWTLRPGQRGRSKEAIEEWRQTRHDDHLFLCEGYIANMMHLEAFITNRLTQLGTQGTK